ncbi:MAG: hypothetical protein ACJAW8_001751 [Oleispira sp.]|jgi:hypothetical protein
MSKDQLSKILALVALTVSTYLAYLLIKDISSVYGNALTWSGGSELSAIGISIFVGTSLISSLLISFFLYRGIYTFWMLLPLAHTIFVFIGIPVYVLALTVLICLGSKYVMPTN